MNQSEKIHKLNKNQLIEIISEIESNMDDFYSDEVWLESLQEFGVENLPLPFLKLIAEKFIETEKEISQTDETD